MQNFDENMTAGQRLLELICIQAEQLFQEEAVSSGILITRHSFP